jgi:hypothetical protein
MFMPKNRQLRNVIIGAHIRDGEVKSADIGDLSIELGDLKGEVRELMGSIAMVEVTTAGGGASEVMAVPGLTGADSKVVVTLTDNGTNNVTLLQAAATGANQVTVVFSGDPSNDAIVTFFVQN